MHLFVRLSCCLLKVWEYERVSHLPPIGGLKYRPCKPNIASRFCFFFVFLMYSTLYVIFLNNKKRADLAIQHRLTTIVSDILYLFCRHAMLYYLSLVGRQRSLSQWPKVKENKRTHGSGICLSVRLKWSYFKSSFGLKCLYFKSSLGLKWLYFKSLFGLIAFLPWLAQNLLKYGNLHSRYEIICP